MKLKIVLCLLILQMIILPQTNFIQKITSGDFDARNPFIYKDRFGLYHDMFFELHKNGASNIYSIKYNPNTGLFGDTVALTSGNYLNLNPSYNPNAGLLFQTNKNGNWDIALLTESNNTWSDLKYLTNSTSDEISPKFLESMIPYPQDSTIILFKRDDDIVFLSYKQNHIIENILFHNNPNITYSNFTGLATDIWGATSGYYVFVIEDSLGYRKIVSRHKPFTQSWQEKVIVKDSCNCDNISIEALGYDYWALFYTDTLLNQKRYFAIVQPIVPNFSSELVQVKTNGDLSHLNIFTFLIVTKRSQNFPAEFELYYPHTYIVKQNGISKMRFDISDLGFWYEDSLIQISNPNQNLAIGPVGQKDIFSIIYTVWEDSTDGHIHLYGTPKHISFGLVNDKVIANDFVLYQNYPNPFNPNTTIEYKIHKGSEIRFNVINILGEKVFEKNLGYQFPGNYKIDFSASGGDANNLPSGVYIYSIITDENRLSRKMLLLK